MVGDIVPWKQWPNVTVHEEENLQILLNVSPSCRDDLMTGCISLWQEDDCASHVAQICTVHYRLLLPAASLLTIARQTLKGQCI